jgi:hypothetical protein
MELNIFTIVYLFFRLAPFIVVCFFSLQSVFNQDLKGIIYLVGLIFACFFTVIIGTFPGFQILTDEYGSKMPSTVKQVCRMIELSNGAPISNLPLGQTVLSYTFFYLLYVIVKYKLTDQNMPTMIIFPVMIVADAIWNITNNCSNGSLLFLSLILGGGIGALWAYIIDSTGKVDLQIFNGISSQSVCSRPSKQILRCKMKSGAPSSSPASTTDSNKNVSDELQTGINNLLKNTGVVS